MNSNSILTGGEPTAPSIGTPILAVGTPILDAIEKVAVLVKQGRVKEADAANFLQRIVWGPVVEFIVKMTPTPLDDVALTLIRALYPKK